MTDMIERIALAIQAEMSTHTANMASPHELEQLAKAAIKAMREPTDEMVKAANHFYDYGDWDQAKPFGHGVVEVIIDAALKEN